MITYTGWKLNDTLKILNRSKYRHMCLVAQSCPILCNPMYCSLPGSSIHGIFTATITGVSWYFLLQGIFQIQGSNWSLQHYRRILNLWATGETQNRDEDPQITKSRKKNVFIMNFTFFSYFFLKIGNYNLWSLSYNYKMFIYSINIVPPRYWFPI